MHITYAYIYIYTIHTYYIYIYIYTIFIYIYIYIIFGPKLLNNYDGIFFKSLWWNFLQVCRQIYTKMRTNFPPFFGPFVIFDCNFAKIVAPSSDKNQNCCSASERAVHSEINWKSRWNRPINGNAMPVRTMSHLKNSTLRPRSVTDKITN